ncbi:unnamed protein product [Brachionus calyciflorus]|uniref:Uncharacterized protein n=1 Tax=Brachionus calyciflorus TaxID=104777 RepID=A0A813Q4P5_9BILA|nr:unnamed protein product [Brachionus calyciflorus]
MTNTKLILFFLFVNSFEFSISKAYQKVYRLNENKTITYLVKFLSSETLYPVVLKDETTRCLENTLWYKFGTKQVVDDDNVTSSNFYAHESNYNDAKLISKDLLLLKFGDYILDHYKPSHIYKNKETTSNNDYDYRDEEFDTNKSEEFKNQCVKNNHEKIYTVAYFDDLELIIEEDNTNVIVSCKIDITIPKFISEHQKMAVNKEIESLIVMKIKLKNQSVMNDDLFKNVMTMQNKSILIESDYLQIHEAKIGPFIFKKTDLNKNIECELLLKDYDFTNVLRKTASSKIINLNQKLTSSASCLTTSVAHILFFLIIYFFSFA